MAAACAPRAREASALAGILDDLRLAPAPDPGSGFLIWDGFEVTRGEFLAGREAAPRPPRKPICR
ncbi:MAG: hypothetical protein ACE5H3_05090 [Planctomycetota bacterium]